MATINKSRVSQCVFTNNTEILHAIQVEIHTSNSSSQCINFLPEHLDTLPRLSLLTKEVKTLHKHTTRTASRIVNAFVWFWLEDFRHQCNDCAVGVELLSCIASIVSKLTHKVFVCLAHLIGRTGRQAKVIT